MSTVSRIGILVDDISLPNIKAQLDFICRGPADYEVDVFYHEGEPTGSEPYNTHHVSRRPTLERLFGAPGNIIARIVSFAFKGRKYVQKKAPDALVAFTNPPVLGTAAALATLNTPSVSVYRYASDVFREYTSASGIEKVLKYIYYNGWGKISLNCCDYSIALGEKGAKRLVSSGSSPDTIYIIPPAIEREKIHTESSISEPIEGSNVGLYVGRLSKEKGIDVLIEIADQLSDEDFQFVAVGEGEYKEKIESMSDDAIISAGYVSHEEIGKYYSSADFLILPSRHEGLPNVVLEALSYDLPIYSTPVGELSEIADCTFRTTNEAVESLKRGPIPSPTTDIDSFEPSIISKQFIDMIEDVK